MDKKKLFIALLVLILIISVAGFIYFYPLNEITGHASLHELAPGDDSRIERIFSQQIPNPGEEINVTLVVIIDSDYNHQALAIEENVPSECSIINSGSGIQNRNTLKWSVINDTGNIESHNYSYRIEYPSSAGSYSFAGSYVLDGMDVSNPISGEQTLGETEYTEEETSSENDNNTEDSSDGQDETNNEGETDSQTGENENEIESQESNKEDNQNSKPFQNRFFSFILTIVLTFLLIAISVVTWLYYQEKNR